MRVTSVGVVGLGEIGGSVASALAAAGHEVTVCDVRPEATANLSDRCRVVDDPAALGRSVDVVIVAVVNDDQVRGVLLGPLGALTTMRPGSTAIVVSTVSMAALRDVGEAARSAGVAVVDCGVSGGPAAAAAGKFVSMVGGEDGDVARVLPVIDSFSSLAVRMGPLGAGLKAKLARNVVQYGSWLAAYEAQRIAEAAGIDLQNLARVIKESDRMIGGASALMFRETVAPFGPEDDERLVGAMRSAAALAEKDLDAALDLAWELELDCPLTELAESNIGSVFGVEP
jgi:3-hydroxyisobutyrate dehydrogenase-like beta-hydroxyacid dehydrogenase